MGNLIKLNLRNIKMKVKEHSLKKQLDSLRQDILKKNKIINHLFNDTHREKLAFTEFSTKIH